MFRLATSPIAPLLGQRLPARAQARLMNRSYLQMQRTSGQAERVWTTSSGDLFHADLSSFQEWHRWVYSQFEDQVAQLFSRLVQPGGRCLLVGAGIGLHAVRLAKLTGPAGEVIVIEPDLELARRATQNLALNGLANARVISATSGTAQAAVADRTGLSAQTVIVIDDMCPGPFALMKIDTGGHEAAVVAGATATIERDRPAIIFEYAPKVPTDHTECPFVRLVETGYLMYRIRNRRNHLTGRYSTRLDPLYAQPETGGRLLAVSDDDASRIISLVAFRDGRI